MVSTSAPKTAMCRALGVLSENFRSLTDGSPDLLSEG